MVSLGFQSYVSRNVQSIADEDAIAERQALPIVSPGRINMLAIRRSRRQTEHRQHRSYPYRAQPHGWSLFLM
jgi:hypothetical protein